MEYVLLSFLWNFDSILAPVALRDDAAVSRECVEPLAVQSPYLVFGRCQRLAHGHWTLAKRVVIIKRRRVKAVVKVVVNR